MKILASAYLAYKEKLNKKDGVGYYLLSNKNQVNKCIFIRNPFGHYHEINNLTLYLTLATQIGGY